ncbi:MAG: hypothetical protein LBK53_08975 [Heliobacteriaceae bacterium]|nr:hypothetical protein [Heliobacteriaceae bacterium]
MRIKRAAIEGREVYEVTMPDGKRALASSPQEVIGFCNALLIQSIKPEKTKNNSPAGMDEGTMENPGKQVAKKLADEVGLQIDTKRSGQEFPKAPLNYKAPDKNLLNVIRHLDPKVMEARYEAMGNIYSEIVQKRSSEIEALSRDFANNKQKFAEGFTKILMEEFGLKDLDLLVEVTNTGDVDGYMNYLAGGLAVNETLNTPQTMGMLVSHEFVHFLQYKDVVCKEGEAGIRALLKGETGVTAEEVINLQFTQHLLKYAKENPVEAGSLNDYMARIYKPELTNPKGSNNPGYREQTIERETYYLGNNRTGRALNKAAGNDDDALLALMQKAREQASNGEKPATKLPDKTPSTDVHERFTINEHGETAEIAAGKLVEDAKAQAQQIAKIKEKFGWSYWNDAENREKALRLFELDGKFDAEAAQKFLKLDYIKEDFVRVCPEDKVIRDKFLEIFEREDNYHAADYVAKLKELSTVDGKFDMKTFDELDNFAGTLFEMKDKSGNKIFSDREYVFDAPVTKEQIKAAEILGKYIEENLDNAWGHNVTELIKSVREDNIAVLEALIKKHDGKTELALKEEDFLNGVIISGENNIIGIQDLGEIMQECDNKDIAVFAADYIGKKNYVSTAGKDLSFYRLYEILELYKKNPNTANWGINSEREFSPTQLVKLSKTFEGASEARKKFMEFILTEKNEDGEYINDIYTIEREANLIKQADDNTIQSYKALRNKNSEVKMELKKWLELAEITTPETQALASDFIQKFNELQRYAYGDIKEIVKHRASYEDAVFNKLMGDLDNEAAAISNEAVFQILKHEYNKDNIDYIYEFSEKARENPGISHEYSIRHVIDYLYFEKAHLNHLKYLDEKPIVSPMITRSLLAKTSEFNYKYFNEFVNLTKNNNGECPYSAHDIIAILKAEKGKSARDVELELELFEVEVDLFGDGAQGTSSRPEKNPLPKEEIWENFQKLVRLKNPSDGKGMLTGTQLNEYSRNAEAVQLLAEYKSQVEKLDISKINIDEKAINNFLEGLPNEYIAMLYNRDGQFGAAEMRNALNAFNEVPFMRDALADFSRTGKLNIDKIKNHDLARYLLCNDEVLVKFIEKSPEDIAQNPRGFKQKQKITEELNNILYDKTEEFIEMHRDEIPSEVPIEDIRVAFAQEIFSPEVREGIFSAVQCFGQKHVLEFINNLSSESLINKGSNSNDILPYSKKPYAGHLSKMLKDRDYKEFIEIMSVIQNADMHIGSDNKVNFDSDFSKILQDFADRKTFTKEDLFRDAYELRRKYMEEAFKKEFATERIGDEYYERRKSELLPELSDADMNVIKERDLLSGNLYGEPMPFGAVIKHAKMTDAAIEATKDLHKFFLENKAKLQQHNIEPLTDANINDLFLRNSLTDFLQVTDAINIKHAIDRKYEGLEDFAELAPNLAKLSKENMDLLRANLEQLQHPEQRLEKLEIICGIAGNVDANVLGDVISGIRPSQMSKEQQRAADRIFAADKPYSEQIEDFITEFKVPENKTEAVRKALISAKLKDAFITPAPVKTQIEIIDKKIDSIKNNDKIPADKKEVNIAHLENLKREIMENPQGAVRPRINDKAIQSVAGQVEAHINVPNNRAEFNSKVNSLIYKKAGVKVSPELLQSLTYDNQYMAKIFIALNNSRFKPEFINLIKMLDTNPAKELSELREPISGTETMTSKDPTEKTRAANAETKKLFAENGLDYGKWTKYDRESKKEFTVITDVKKSTAAARNNLMEEMSSELAKRLDQNETDKLQKILESNDIQNADRKQLETIIKALEAEMAGNPYWRSKDKSIVEFKSHINGTHKKAIHDLQNMKNSTDNLLVRLSDDDNVGRNIFLGNHVGCCTSLGKGNEYAACQHLMNSFVRGIEIVDKNGTSFGNSMCYFAKVDGKLTFIIDSFEANGKFNSAPEIANAVIDYAKQTCKKMGQPDANIMFGPNFNKIDKSRLKLTKKHTIEVIGRVPEQTYIDAIGGANGRNINIRYTGRDMYEIKDLQQNPS